MLTSDGTNNSFDDWADSLLESLLLVSSSGMWNEDSGSWGVDGNVVTKNFFSGKVFIPPLSVELWNSSELSEFDV